MRKKYRSRFRELIWNALDVLPDNDVDWSDTTIVEWILFNKHKDELFNMGLNKIESVPVSSYIQIVLGLKCEEWENKDDIEYMVGLHRVVLRELNNMLKEGLVSKKRFWVGYTKLIWRKGKDRFKPYKPCEIVIPPDLMKDVFGRK